ncbi:hypothetical protein DFJ58DRAFT_743571 [Suillus subalutaceus]|uniref:uncharacterized protein n=1 Tax=Suillus subalutaceus TaxID=48586 RepID=UPI001B87A579|nr:uncharacterized protein DFJ58DRAFT_743571 [Suillus subalutaceus]KAG1864114.1 hypothetical protein DFJ58DRAFT_743571 [Suillus subalutaceus]
MKSQSKRSQRTSPYQVENAPKRKCMTTGQLNILDPYYAKNDHPTKDDIELLAKAIDKVKNWFNNRRAKEARLQRNPSDMLSQCFWNMNIDDTDDLSDSDDNDDEHESGDAQGALNQGGLDQEVLYQEARACVLAMAKMTPEEVNAAFILNNLKRRIIVHPPQK